MGVLRSIFIAILGPMVLYTLLIAHVIYQHKFRGNDVLPKPHWPEGTKEDMKKAIIANRKFIVDDLKTVMAGKDLTKIIKNRMTNDFVWEDPTQRLAGHDEILKLLGLGKYMKSVTFDHFNEVHSAHEILLDWAVTVNLKFPEVAITVPMRSHVMMEPPEVHGGAEKIFKVVEDWGGNPPLTEASCKPSVLGKVHQLLRRFHGSMIIKGVDLGLF